MMSVTPIPALSDNYIWLLRQDTSQSVCVVDPGEAAPVIEFLERESLSLESILITHHHHDHTGGVAELIKRYSPPIPLSKGSTKPWATATKSASWVACSM